MINRTKTTRATVFLMFLVLLGFDPPKDYYNDKEDFEKSIYLFEKLINQEKDPSMADYAKLFSFEQEFELSAEIAYKHGNSLETCSMNKKCFNDPENNPSMFFKYLRSKDGPFFKKSKSRKIKIYLYNNYRFKIPDNGDSFYVDALVYVEEGLIIPCEFDMMIYRYEQEKINNIKIGDKRLYDLVDSFRSSEK